MSPAPLVIAVLGAECTGKTSLAQGLSRRLAQTTGLRCTWVPEWLRQWCDQHGRTPAAHEQAEIARAQHLHIASAAQRHDIVVADTTALMTAIYSQQIFGDGHLRADAVALHRQADLTLLTAPDLPWVADGHQRDGPHVQAPVDALLRQWLAEEALAWAPVQGQGPARLACAERACALALRRFMQQRALLNGQLTVSDPGG